MWSKLSKSDYWSMVFIHHSWIRICKMLSAIFKIDLVRIILFLENWANTITNFKKAEWIITNYASTTGNCAIYCVQGLLGTKTKSIVHYDWDDYSIVRKPTLDDELKKIRDMVLHENFNMKAEKHKIITPRQAHKQIYPTNNEAGVGRGKCTCGSSNKSHKSTKKVSDSLYK